MHPTFVSLLGLALAVGPTFAVPSQGGSKKDCPYAAMKRDSLDFPGMPNVHSARGLPAAGKQGVMLMNRIAPSTSTLYIANADGTNERQLLNDTTTFDYHGSFSPDGEWITFTSERNGDGNSDLYRVRVDGTGLEEVIATPSFEDAGVISPDGSKVAYVSTANGYTANIWAMNINDTTSAVSLTNTDEVKGVSWSPNGYFRPAWSPDGEWLAFSSDRNTNWTGHGNGTGWEHTQELSVYVIRPNGSDFRQLATKSGYCLGSPQWSPDGTRVVYYEITRENTWDAHRPEDLNSTSSQIVSVDFATGLDRVEETSSDSLKLYPTYVSQTEIGYLIKGPTDQVGLNYTGNTTGVLGEMRSPSWSADGKYVVYEKVGWTIRAMEKSLYSWDSEWDYRFTDVFPTLSLQNKLAITQKQLGNSSIVTMNPDGTDVQIAFDVYATGQVNTSLVVQGLSGAFQPDWSPDGEWIAFGLGSWFQERAVYTAYIYRATANGSYYEQLTNGSINSGFPSYSHDGRYLVYRVWSETEGGLRVMDLANNNSVSVLTTEYDNLPHFSPDGEKILFTRKMNATNFDVCTIRPNGTDLQVLTSSGANDAHAVWTADGRIMWSSGMYGFRAEAACYDSTFQPYGQIFVMNSDGSNKTILTDSMWEDSMPLYLPNAALE